jgi:uncharacterized protein YoxC
VLLAFSAGDVAYLALAVFLLAVGLGLGFAFLRLAATFQRLSSLIRGTERELLPVIGKVGGSVDRVNAQLDKLDHVTDSAVEAVDAVDATVRTVSGAVKTPVRKVAGLSSGLAHGWATLRAKRDWRGAVESAKAASARRQADLDDDLRRPHG